MKQGSSFAVKRGSLIALACAAAFAVPQTAMAAGDGVSEIQLKMTGHPLTLQGAISVGVANIKSTGSTLGAAMDAESRYEVWTGESNFRISASQKLSGGFFQGVGFQMESGFNTDDGTTSSSGGTLASRNSGLGVKTSIGSFWAGKWDTPYKDAVRAAYVTSSSMGLQASSTGFLGSQGLGGGTGGSTSGGVTCSAAATSCSTSNNMNFRRRNANAFNYYSPEFANTQITLQFVPDERAAVGPSPRKPWLWSGAVQHSNGPLNLSLGYERHEDFLWGGSVRAGALGLANPGAGAGTSSTSTGLVLAGNYAITPNTKISLGWERLKWDQSGPAVVLSSLSSDKWYVGLIQKLGAAHEIRAAYGRAGDYSCTGAGFNCNDSGAQLYNFLYSYRLDKASRISVFYGRLNNDRNANYVASGAATSPGQTTAGTLSGTGHSDRSISVGMSSSF